MSSTPTTAVQVTDAEMRRAFALCRGRNWPVQFEEAMADPVRARLVTTCARGLHYKAQAKPSKKAPVPGQAPYAHVGAPLPQKSLLDHWPARRVTPAGFVDHKRAASGDRDD